MMFFRIDESVIELVENQVNLPHLCVCIDELFRARRLGKHLIYCKVSSLEKIEALPGVSEATRLTIRKIKSLQRFKKSIFDSMSVYVNVVAEPGTIKSSWVDDKLVIDISIDNFAGGDFLESTTLLAENNTDCEIFKFIAKIKNNNSSSLKNLRHSIDAVAGGGSQTPRQYDINCAGRRFQLCIVDGDLEYEGAALGTNTAAPIMHSHNVAPVPYSLPLVLKCYSIENLLPAELVMYCTNQDPSTSPYIREIQRLQGHNSWPYIPLKAGKICTSFVGDDDKGRYWMSQKISFAPKSEDCLSWGGGVCAPPCRILDCMPDKTARKVADCLIDLNEKGLLRDFSQRFSNMPQSIEGLWSEIANHVNSWACSGDRITAF